MARSYKPFYHQAYTDKGTGPTVVILHGPFGNLQMWRHVLNGLKENYRVIIPRLPLFGVPANSTSVKDLSDVLFEFFDWHQLTDFSIIGHGIGGQIALRHAFDYPQITRDVVISGTSNFHFKDVAYQVNYKHDHNTVTNFVRDAFYDERKVTPTMVDSGFDSIHDSSHWVSINRFLENVEGNAMNPLLSCIQQPVLLAWGEHDRITPPDVAIHLHDQLPNGHLKFIASCGHLPMIDEPARFLSIVTEFLRGNRI